MSEAGAGDGPSCEYPRLLRASIPASKDSPPDMWCGKVYQHVVFHTKMHLHALVCGTMQLDPEVQVLPAHSGPIDSAKHPAHQNQPVKEMSRASRMANYGALSISS